MKFFISAAFAILLAFFSGPSSAESTLYQGWGLQPGQGITSPNGEYTLVMQGDGNLVFYRNSDGGVRWHSNTYGAFGAFLVMQTDGNAVAYFDPPCPKPPKGQVQYCKPDIGRLAIWYSATSGNPGAYMSAQDNGDLVVVAANGRPLWGLGGDPVKQLADPSKLGDLVGREMEHDRPYAYLGHIGFYDGGGIYEVLNDGALNAAAYNTLVAFKARAPGAKYWGGASPNIPEYYVSGCWADVCGNNGYGYQTVTGRVGMAHRGFQILVLGADYTYLAPYERALPKTPNSRAARGTYRCDTFVLDVMTDNGVISDKDGRSINVTALPAQSPYRRWNEFMVGVRSGVITPKTIFEKMREFKG